MILASELRGMTEGRIHSVTALALNGALTDLGAVVEHLRLGLVDYANVGRSQHERHGARQELSARAADLLDELARQGLVAPRHGGHADLIARLAAVARVGMERAPGRPATMARVRNAELAAVEAVLVDVGYLG